MLCAMRDDGALAALERSMRRPLALAGAAFIISMGAFVVGLMLIVDSSSNVRFPSAVAAIASDPSRAAVRVRLDVGGSGTTRVAIFRGGQAAPSGDVGQVGFRGTTPPNQPNPVAATVTTTTKPPAAKKSAKRATSIGATSGPNGDSGLAPGAGPAGGGGSTPTPATGVPSP
jgi:hypothetical protein